MNGMLRLMPARQGFLSILPELDMLRPFFYERELPEMFGKDGEVAPAFDITETESGYTISGEVPGIETKDLDVTFADSILTIKGEKKREHEEKDEHFHRIEREYGSFQREFLLPEQVKTEELKAIYKNGILKITLPKAEPKTQKIEVKESASADKTETPVEVQ